MENGPFIDDKHYDLPEMVSFHSKLLNNQRVNSYIHYIPLGWFINKSINT